MNSTRAPERVSASIDQLIERVRQRLRRLTAVEAKAAIEAGAVLADIRSEMQRRAGVVPGSIFIPRNVLEWRVDPSSAYHDDRLTRRAGPLILMCAQGYQSSLAAGTLQELGIADATDLIDGFEGWVAAGLPIEPCLPVDF